MKSHLSLFLVLFILNCISAFAQSTEWRKKHYNLEKNNLAISGFDPVSYFDNLPQKGTPSFNYEYEGIVYNFSSEKNMELFKSSPIKYEPQYGGWCAYAMGDSGEKVEIDPNTYKIIDGKLYLFYNKYFTNTLDYWNKDPDNLKSMADTNWKKY